jgi:hypothetical protein
MKCRTIFSFTAAAVLAFCAAPAVLAFAADVHESGTTQNGGFWEYLNRGSVGDAEMQNTEDGSCICKWKDIRDVNFSSGIRFDPPRDFTMNTAYYLYRYQSDYAVSGEQTSVYYGIHGRLSQWNSEFFVIDGWKNWRPPSGGVQGKVGEMTVDGVYYDVYETLSSYRSEHEPCRQYWSVRKENAMPEADAGTVSGTVNLLTHLQQWKKLGLTDFGTLLEEASLFTAVYSDEHSTCEGQFTFSRNKLAINRPTEPAETAATASEPAILRGDADCSGVADISDAVLLAKFVSGDSTAKISDRGLQNGDVDGKEGITDDDVTYLLRALVNLIKL